MSLWPFRRKGGRKRSRSGATLSDLDVPNHLPLPQDNHTHGPALTTRHSAKKKQRVDSKAKLHRHERSYSYSPDRNDAIHVAQDKRHQRHAHPNPPSSAEKPPPQQARPRHQRQHSLGQLDGNGDATAKPAVGATASTRRKLSRRKKDAPNPDFVPVRPAVDSSSSGRPLARDTKHAKPVSPHNKASWEKRVSDISLPIPASIHSTMSSDSEYGALRLSPLDVLSPRPTLRFSTSPRWGQAGPIPTRTHSDRRKLSDRPQIPEATLRAHKRIDDLADDLDASDLRELMERDQRRRDIRRQREQDRLERRLARKVEQQRLAQEAAAREGSEPPPNLERGAVGRELAGVATPECSAMPTADFHSDPVQLDPAHEGNRAPTVEAEDGTEGEAYELATVTPTDLVGEPSNQAVRGDTTESAESASPNGPIGEEPTIATVAADEIPTPSMQPRTRSFRKIKKSPLQPRPLPEPPVVASRSASQQTTNSDGHRKSDGSSRKRISLSSLFKWANKNRRSSGPSSFSNTSREEIQNLTASLQSHGGSPPRDADPAQIPTHPVTNIPATPQHTPPRPLATAFPKRTKSKFREDLPELPISPPDSRVNSPQPAKHDASSAEQTRLVQRAPSPMELDTPSSSHSRGGTVTPRSLRSANNAGASPEAQSVSLASIDSEASWLSGRLSPHRSPVVASSFHCRTISDESSSQMTVDVMESEIESYHLGSRQSLRHDQPIQSIEQADDVVASRISADESSISLVYEESVGDMEATDKIGGLQRATSVNLGEGNARRISAGSAKLLELTPRASIDSRRRSLSIAFI